MFVNFTKMHGLGNDFVVIDTISQAIQLSAKQFQFIADRHMGVGCDQVLLVEKSHSNEADFRYRIFNADGYEVEQCGNGARCFARFVRDTGLSDKDIITVETNNGTIELSHQSDGQIRVNIGKARLAPGTIPFVADHQAPQYPLEVNGKIYDVGVLSMGNPHVILNFETIDDAPVTTLGPIIEHHPRFPNRVNVGFMQVIDRKNIHLRVWERGVGETLACGTGACAAVVSGIIRGWLEPRVVVNLHKGQLVIEWQGEDQAVVMTGPAESVFEGTIQL